MIMLSSHTSKQEVPAFHMKSVMLSPALEFLHVSSTVGIPRCEDSTTLSRRRITPSLEV